MRQPNDLLGIAGLLLAVASGTADADVSVTTLDGQEPIRGISLTADAGTLAVQTAAGPVVRIPTDRVVEVVTVPPPPPMPPATHPFEVLLVDGSRLRGVLRAGDSADAIRLRNPVLNGGGETEIDLESVRAVRRVDGTAIPGAARLVRIPEKDAAYRLSGARVEGLVNRFTNTGLEIARGTGLGDSEVAYRELAAVFIENDPLPLPDELHVVARLADGSAVILTKGFRVAAGQLRGETPGGIGVRVPVARIAALGFMGGSFVHLSDLSPVSVKREPFFPLPDGPAAEAMLDFVCPVRMDKSPDGHPITLRKRRYFKGIGVRPTTEIEFALQGKYRVFTALCGIDDEVLGPGYGHGAGTGSVVFVVKVDGKVVHRTEPVEGGRPPVRVRVSVAGAQRLALLVTLVPKSKMPGGSDDSPELDNAVWARPLLIR